MGHSIDPPIKFSSHSIWLLEPPGVDLLLCGAFLWLPKRLAGSDFFDRCDASWTPQDRQRKQHFRVAFFGGKESQTGDFWGFGMFFHRKNLGHRCSNRISSMILWPCLLVTDQSAHVGRQDQRHPLPKPSWHLHGAPSRTDLIFVGSRRKRWSALRVGVWWQERTRRTIGSSRQWVNIEGSTSGGFVESTVTCSWSCGVREGNGVCREMEMTCRCRWPGTRGFWGQPGMFPTRKRFT